MSNKDEVKGRAKQAAGVLTGDKKLEREGKADRIAGTVKEKVDEARDWIADKVRTEK
ncbi:MAG: CsbD family protein [Ilumatobacteraceae bacterium]